MNISSRLKLAAVLSVVVVTGIGVVLWRTTERVKLELGKSEVSGEVFQAATSLRYLAQEYMQRHEERARVQWQLRHESLGKVLAGMTQFERADEQETIASLRDTHDSLGRLFRQLLSTYQDHSVDKAKRAILDELQTRLIGQIANKTQSMISDVLSLLRRSRAGVEAAQEQAEVAVLTFGGLAVFVIATTLFLALRSVTRPLERLREGTAIVGAGNLGFRLEFEARDEIGELARSFDAMTDKLRQTTVSRDELMKTNEALQSEILVRQQAEQKVQEQVTRLNLLQHITRAIGERQDLRSIFQVVIRNVEEQLPADFCCVCLYDPADHTLTVTSVGAHSGALALDLAMTEKARVPIDENGLSRSIGGQLVYEPDIRKVSFPFPQRLARGGLNALVIAPLLVESRVFGIFVAARRRPESFVSGECEFLRQLSEHVALASHQAQLHGALQRAYDDLRQTQQAVMQQERLRALGQMASGIAHDINNAISPVTLYTESLLESESGLSARGRDYLQTIQRAIDDVAQTVARMREFYRQREPELTLSTINLNPLLQQVIDLTRARWSDMPQQRGVFIKMQTQIEPDLPPVMGNAAEIREALINLIFNAVDAMPEGGTLTLRTRVMNPERRVCIEVADTGVGMDEETRSRCLEPFYTTKGERGTGLGLAMVYGVAQRHSAELEIESVVREGTTIRLSFPLSTVVVDVAPHAVRYDVPAKLRILLVDDDPVLLKSLRNILEGDGHLVTVANGGRGGIDAFRESQTNGAPFEVVITDLGMPHVDGRAVAEAIGGSSPSTPIIMLTGWGQRLVAEGDVPAHVTCVLSKPPKLQELRRTLAEYCRKAAS